MAERAEGLEAGRNGGDGGDCRRRRGCRVGSRGGLGLRRAWLAGALPARGGDAAGLGLIAVGSGGDSGRRATFCTVCHYQAIRIWRWTQVRCCGRSGLRNRNRLGHRWRRWPLIWWPRRLRRWSWRRLIAHEVRAGCRPLGGWNEQPGGRIAALELKALRMVGWPCRLWMVPLGLEVACGWRHTHVLRRGRRGSQPFDL